MNIIKNVPLMAFGLGLGFIVAMSSFKAINGTDDPPVTYHIEEDLGDRYTVTTAGNCDIGTDECSFETVLSPDIDANTFSKAALSGVTIEQGSFSNP